VLRTITPLAGEDRASERVAKAHGVSLHAGVSCEAHQRELRERLCREHGQCANRGAGKLRSGIGRGRCCAGARYGGVSQRCVRRQTWAIG